MICQFCNRLAKSINSNRQHEIRCKSNPAGINVKSSYGMLGKKGANQYTYGATMSDSTKQKISKTSTDYNNARWSNPANRLQQSIAMKKAVDRNPEAYSSSNRGRTKQIIIDGIKLQGQWEVDFYIWAKSQGLEPTRPTVSFEYNWNGIRSYFPDFYIKSMDLYIEVKGYETERDRAKWRDFPKDLRIIKEAEIKQIRQGCFVGL